MLSICPQVLFRYAVAIFKYTEESLLKQNDYMSIVNTLRDRLESLNDIEALTQVRIVGIWLLK